MDDNKIIELFWYRDEMAIDHASNKYQHYVTAIALRILSDMESSMECVNDTWFIAWKHMPPDRPQHLKAYFASITRNLALNRLRDNARQKRGGGEAIAALDELANCAAHRSSVESVIEDKEIIDVLNSWLESLSKEKRVAFILRYWHCQSIDEISKKMGWSEGKTKSLLARLRTSLHKSLIKEDIYL